MADHSILLADANIIIDFLKADKEALSIFCSSLEINIPSVIIQDEVDQLDVEQAKEIGLKIIEPEITQVFEEVKISLNNDIKYGNISFLMDTLQGNTTYLCNTTVRAHFLIWKIFIINHCFLIIS